MATKSSQLFHRAQKRIPGGVNSPVRAFRNVDGEPFFVARAEGARIWDATDHYVAYLKASERSCSAEQLVKEMLKAKEADGVGKRHLRNPQYLSSGTVAVQIFLKLFARNPERKGRDIMKSVRYSAKFVLTPSGRARQHRDALSCLGVAPRESST